MDRKRIIAVTLAAAFAMTASVASADSRGHRGHGHPGAHAAKPHAGGKHGHARHVPPGHAKRQPVQVHHHHHYSPPPVARHVHRPVPYYRFNRGDRLPVDYRRPQYVVTHWHQHRLTPPPPQHHWIQVGADYLLVAIASGIVAHAILGH
ncbi:MAG: RcnB family protein [Burkholderiaceae bacterium]|nr:RcnB family protein [Burkholderiaceae bacterium]